MRFLKIFLMALCFQVLCEEPLSQVELKGSHYLSKPAAELQSQNYFSLFGHLHYEAQKNQFLFKVSGLGEVFSDKSFYFNVPELYVSYAYDLKDSLFLESLKVYVGRHIKEWSRADRYWELGTWNPLNLWEPLYPIPNGLVGAFLDLKANFWLLEFYVGALHLPHTGPKREQDEKTGSISSPSRWAWIPPKEVILPAGFKRDIDYLVGFVKEKLIHDSYALSLKAWLPENKNIWLKGSFGYKQNNSVFLTLNTSDRYKVPASAKKESLIQLKGENHQVIQRTLTGELGIEYKDFSSLFSVSQNKVKLLKDLPENHVLVRSPISHIYLSALAGYKIPLYENIETNFQMAYLHSLNKKKTWTKAREKHHKLFRGFRFDLTTQILSATGLKRDFSLKFWLSPEKWENLFSLDALMHILPSLYVAGRVNILTGEKNNDESFFSEFQSNDSVSWRMGFVF